MESLPHKRTGSCRTLLQTQMVKEAKGGKNKIDFLGLVFTGADEKNIPSDEKESKKACVESGSLH